jgi:hypothetical protein
MNTVSHDRKIDRIHHMAYRCRNAKETVKWYVKHLSMHFLLPVAEDSAIVKTATHRMVSYESRRRSYRAQQITLISLKKTAAPLFLSDSKIKN